MSSSADELTSTLSCTELLADSPSTSSMSVHRQAEPRRRSHRIVLQPVNNRRQGPAVISRKRPSIDSRLNTAQHDSVRTLPDRNLSVDSRILANLKAAETAMAVNCHYFTSIQEHIQPMHREQAIEWIYDVSKEERCEVDIFPLAVALMDRFLSIQSIFKSDIQVLAGVCLFIASKVKAPTPLNAQRMSYYTADSVPVQDFLSWELLVLAWLEWDTNVPTAFDFFDQLLFRMPQLTFVKEAFTAIVHKIQKNSKLGMMIPSLQCALCLIYAMDRHHNQLLAKEIDFILPFALGVEVSMVRAFIPLVERALGCAAPPEGSPAAPCGSLRTPSPSCQVPATPHHTHNDSGFCSGVNSPECADKKEKMDCSPPKMARLAPTH